MAEKKFIATETLYVGRFRAHNIGDEVPAENIEANGWQDKVAGEGTKEGGAALELAGTGPVSPADLSAERGTADLNAEPST